MSSADAWVCPKCGDVFHSVYAFDLHICDAVDGDDADVSHDDE